MERQPNNNEYNPTDDDRIAIAVFNAELNGTHIPPEAARVIASQEHGGQNSDLYSFSSTGAISETLADEIERTIDEQEDPSKQNALVYLLAHVMDREDKGPQENWSQLWLGKGPNEETDSCAACGEHLSSPHGGECPLNPDHQEEPERLSLEEQIKQKFYGMSTSRLIRRMERASDETNLDDETYELVRRLKEKGQTWKWSESFTKPQIIVIDLPEDE